MRTTVLSGGVGGARFLTGLLDAVGPDDEVTVVGNTADDIWLSGLRVCPDLDTVMYTLGGGIDHDRGWGRTDETWNAKDELAAYGADQTWFGLGDRDLATHVLRTQMWHAGTGLAAITERLCQRWQPGVRLLPMTEDEVETHIGIDRDGAVALVHFQEYWIRLRAGVPVRQVVYVGAETATAGPGVVEAIMDADRVVLPPSNPVVSTGAILSVAEVAEAVRTTPAPVVGVSPIIGGAAVRGMAEQLLTGLGVEVGAGAVAEHLGARSRGGFLDGWLVDTSDTADLARVESAGLVGRAVPLWMSGPAATRRLADDALALADAVAG